MVMRNYPCLRTALYENIQSLVISGLSPRVVIGLIVAADAEPEIRKSMRKLISHGRTQLQLLTLPIHDIKSGGSRNIHFAEDIACVACFTISMILSPPSGADSLSK